RVLTGVPERRVAEIVRKRDRLDEVLIEVQGAGDPAPDLRHLERMRKASTEQIALVIDENLGLVFEATKRGRGNHTLPGTLESSPARCLRLDVNPPARPGRVRRVGRQDRFDGSAPRAHT